MLIDAARRPSRRGARRGDSASDLLHLAPHRIAGLEPSAAQRAARAARPIHELGSLLYHLPDDGRAAVDEFGAELDGPRVEVSMDPAADAIARFENKHRQSGAAEFSGG